MYERLALKDGAGWAGPIDQQYSDAQCPNVGCHGPWPGVTSPGPCETICDGVKGCNAMNFNGGGCCLRACAPGRQITRNATKSGGLSYFRVGPAPPPCSTIKDKGRCLEPFCRWDGQHCKVPPLPPPPPPPPPAPPFVPKIRPVRVLKGESLDVRIYVDRPVVEFYINGGRSAYTHAAADFSVNSTAVRLFNRGATAQPIEVSNIAVHGMGCGWVDTPPSYVRMRSDKL
jgi:hypothetical protein